MKRYEVVSNGKTVYSGNLRFVAWLVWLVNRRNHSTAYDCGIWVVDPSYWLKVKESGTSEKK